MHAMKFSVVICFCLLAWIEANDMTVDITMLESGGSAVIATRKNGKTQYAVNIKAPIDADANKICLKIVTVPEAGGENKEFEANLCDDDTSSTNYTLATMVRTSLKIKCPAAVNGKTTMVPITFPLEGKFCEEAKPNDVYNVDVQSYRHQGDSKIPDFAAKYKVTVNS